VAEAALDAPLVSMVVPVRNEEAYLARCVESLLEQDYPLDKLEVIIVVGSSHDRTRDVAERLAQDARVRVIDNPGGQTPVSLNLGMRAARGAVVGRLDGHAWAAPGFLRAGIEALARTGASGVGGLCTFVGDGPVGEAIALALNSRAGGGNAAFRVGGAERDADTIAFGLYPRAAFDRVGEFDETLLKNQDDEWHHRARLAGERLLFTPTMGVSYVARSSLPALWRQYSSWGVFRVATIAKHRRFGAARQMAPPLLVLGLASALALEAASGRRAGRRLAAGYVAALAAAGAYEGARSRRPQAAPLIGAALGVMQLSYGCGFWGETGRRLASRARPSTGA
jgi:glycosyltransferase involved in cell wall biosynthesis